MNEDEYRDLLADNESLKQENRQLRDQVEGVTMAFNELKVAFVSTRSQVRNLRYSTPLDVSNDIADIVAEIDEAS